MRANMEHKGYLPLFLALLSLTRTIPVEATPADNFAFQTFLMVHLRNYSDWLVTSNLDPTPLIPDVIDVVDFWEGLWDIKGKIWNQRMFNHSKVFSWEADVDLDKSSFSVDLDFLGYSMAGEYIVEGTFHGEPVSGSGAADHDAHADWTGRIHLEVTFNKFGITQEGYVDLSTAEVVQDYTAGHSGTYEGLSAGGGENENRVNGMLSAGHKKEFKNWNPLAGYLQTFLQAKLNETALSDIIGSVSI